jgi:hypothetical protein
VGRLRALVGFYDRGDPESSQGLVATLLFSSGGVILVISAHAAVIAGALAHAGACRNPENRLRSPGHRQERRYTSGERIMLEARN